MSAAVASGMARAHRVLLLGSGMTAAPLVEYLTRDGTTSVTVASNVEHEARQLAAPYPNTSATTVDIKSNGSLSELIPNHNLVISYVPYQLHPIVARQCINHGVSMVTASYVSPALRELHDSACDASVTLLNEIGLDPGIDHMLAMQCFDEVHSKGGKVVSFESWCGGLPAPECANNPLKYKFSWSPRNVLFGLTNSAKYIKDGKVVELPGEGGVLERVTPVDIYPDIQLEGYANRDSTRYVDIYHIPEAHTIFRGTLRYPGFSRVALALLRLGLLSDSPVQRLQPGAADLAWKDLLAMLISQTQAHGPNLRSAVLEVLGGSEASVEAMEELGLLSDAPVVLCGSPLDALSAHLQERLRYAPGERDAVYLHHSIGVEWANGSKETRHINLRQYGIPHGFTAMAQTVGTPTAIAAKMLLTGELTARGIVTPTTSDIYTPILHKLKAEGIEATFSTEAS